MFLLIQIINTVFRLYSYLILARIFLTVDPHNPVVQFIYRVTEPILAPFRIILPLGGMGLDLSPIIVFFLLNLLQRAIINILFSIAI